MQAGTPGDGAASGGAGGYSSAALMQKGREKEKELKDRLREFFAEKAVPFDEAWRVEVKIRATGTSLGTSDAYYFSPAGKRYRSRMEIARDFGLADEKEPRSGGGGGKPRNRKSEGGGGGAGGGAAAGAVVVAGAPLSRGEALAAAAKRREAFVLPHRLACGVTVTNLGVLHPGNPAYCNAERLWPAGFTAEWEDEKGVRFINSITETPSGPVFRIKAQRLAHGDKPATEVVELGAGTTPDAAYKDAEERQSEALEIALLNRSIKQRGGHHLHHFYQEGMEDPASPVAPAGRALDAAEHLLVKCRPLQNHWGLERFGLADSSVLQAIEGLPGVDYCPHYRLVDERPGGWVAEVKRLNAELAARGKKQLPLPVVETKKAAGESGGGSAPRKRGPRPSRKEAEENAVRRVLDSMVKQVEMDEVRAIGLEQKARAKAEKAAERERKRLDKEKMQDAMHKLKEQQRLQQKAAFIEAQRRQAELNATVEDSQLPNAEEPAPEPAYIARGRLPLHQQAVLLEAWQFVSRFGEPLLGFPPDSRMPTLQQLEAALLGEAPQPPVPAADAEGGEGSGDAVVDAAAAPPDAAVQLQVALVEFLVAGLFQSTAQAITGANSDISMADLRGPGKHAHPLAIRKETWQEAARRYLTVLATSAMTQAKDTGVAGATQPLCVMDPWVILQYLTAGPPSSLTQGAAALPRGASKTAGHSLIARADAEAVAAAETAFAAIACGAGSTLPPEPEAVAAKKRLLRCVLKDVIQASKMKKGDGRLLCYCGQAAAAATKGGRPLDLRCIAARIDAGVYTALPDPLAAFAADIKYAAQLMQTGCHRQNSLFAQEYLDKGGAELSALAVSKLEACLREIQLMGEADYLAQHAPLPHQRRSTRPTPEPAGAGDASSAAPREASAEPSAAAAAAAAGGEAGEEAAQSGARADQQGASAIQRHVTDPIRDLDRPFAPFKETGSWRGCVVCWSDEDPARLLLCDACDCQTHSYCLEPPLEELPLQTEPYLCPRCQKLQGPDAVSGGKPLAVEFARASGGDTTWRLAQLLASKDYSEWGVEDRCALLRLLCSLCAESAALHDTLHGDEEEVREKKKEIGQMRQEVKKLQAEMAAQQQAQVAAQQQAAQPPAGAAAPAGDSSAAPGSSVDAQTAAAAPAPAPAVSPLPPLPPQRSTRRARDLGAEVERMVEKISYLEDVISQKGPVRLEPIGLDRHYNRYWLLPAAATASDPAHPPPQDAPPVLVIERHSLDSILPANVAAAAAAVAGAGGEAVAGSSSGGEAAEPAWQVGLYNSILHLQQLAQWLNPKGTRERPLAEAVTRLLDQHQQWAMQHAQPPRAPMEEDAPAPDPVAVRAAAVGALQEALLSFEEGNQPATYDELTGSEERRAHWRAMVSAASTPQTLMQALLVLEGMVRPEFLKQQWRPFAQPAPHSDEIRTLPAVWLRLEALKAAVKLKVTINMRLAKEALGGGLLPAGGGSRYSLRESKLAGKRSYYEGPDPGSRADSGGDSDGPDGLRETRAERAAKRAAQREMPDDEAVARELNAELNNPGSRRTRQRQQHHQQQHMRLDDEEEWEDDQEDSHRGGDDDADVDFEMEDVGSD